MKTFPPYIDRAPARRACGEIVLPGSKSISNRVLLLSALAVGRTHVKSLLDSDDTRVMLDSLRKLGVSIEPAEPNAVDVSGSAGRFPVSEAELFVGNSGLTIRTLVPAIAAARAGRGGSVRLSGVPRMHERPIGDLVDGLRQWGAQIDYLGTPGYPPLRIAGSALAVSQVRVRGDTSSQFLTGMLQAAPLLAVSGPVRIDVEGDLISKPYIEITLNLMQRFGVEVHRQGWSSFEIPAGQHYQSPGALAVEGDASSASYFLAAGAIAGGPVRVIGAGRASIQGDVQFAHALEAMGAQIAWGPDWIEASSTTGLRGIDLDCNHIPDAAMTLAVCALHAQGPTTLRNIGSWRVKETDRLAAMAAELRKLGATVEEGADWLRVHPPAHLLPATIATYEDHRMAMCFSLAALSSVTRAGAPVRIDAPECVAKTFPTFFETLDTLLTH